jgi:hypothetical protein
MPNEPVEKSIPFFLFLTGCPKSSLPFFSNVTKSSLDKNPNSKRPA